MGEVTFRDVSKRFSIHVDGELHHVQALDRVSFTVANGEIVALIGPSGCGKTTALRVAMGLDPSTSGRVTVDGREVRGCGHDRGMVFQHAELLPWLNARQNVMFGLEMKGMRGGELRDLLVGPAGGGDDHGRVEPGRAQARGGRLARAAGRVVRRGDALPVRGPGADQFREGAAENGLGRRVGRDDVAFAVVDQHAFGQVDDHRAQQLGAVVVQPALRADSHDLEGV